MRIRVLAFFSIILGGMVWWFTRPQPASISRPATPAVQSQTLNSETSTAPIAAQKPPVTFRKMTGDQKSALTVFQQHHKLDGPPGNDSSPMVRYNGLQMSKPVQVNARGRVVLGARAVPTGTYDSSFGPVLFEQNGFSIVALNTKNDPSWNDLVMHESDRPVVVNPGNGRLGIVTGTLIVKFTDIHQADKLAGREGLQLMSVDESIGVAYFHAPENYHLLSGSEKLRKSADVERVELEVVENFKGAW